MQIAASGCSFRVYAFHLLAIPVLVLAGFAGPVRAAYPVDREPVPPARKLALRKQLAAAKAQRLARVRALAKSPTINQDNYDATYYDLDLTLDPSTQVVSGTVTMSARARGTLASADLDLLANMTVSACTAGGAPASFTHTGDIVTITLDRTYADGETFSVTITYSGTPDASYGAFGFDMHNGSPMIWSLSEPYGARSWWPCKDVPSDKADSVDVHITAPDTLVTASNGTLRSITTSPGSKTTWWHESHAIATYLVSVAVHPYTQYSDWYRYTPTDSMEIQFFVFPDHFTSVQPTYAEVKNMLGVFSGLFGEYPFVDEKYGHAEFLWGGGMEHQTLTSLGGWWESVIAHELGHQWWGDMITCRTFHHIWLNEGFATYCEALWDDATYGRAAYTADMAAAKYLGPGTVYVADTTSVNRIFDSSLSYNKASWVLHMLRHVVGDSTFFDCLRAYHNDPRYEYGTATTEQFRDVCASVAGMNLDWFFQEWIYGEYYPAYAFQWNPAPASGGYDVTVTIDQQQTTGLFRMPVDVTLQMPAGDSTFVVWDSLATQQFVLHVAQVPTGVLLDKDEWILRTVEPPLTNPTLDRGILVVNGVDWSVYGSEITTAYGDSIFWGSQPISFWDHFPAPAGGYPSTLPAPLGHGTIPPDTLQQFSAVVWVGNNYNGDLATWYDAPILSYLQAGGDVLLLSRYGQSFLAEPLRAYLGVTWMGSATSTLLNCSAADPQMVNMPLIGSQSACAVFDTTLATPESALLFTDNTIAGGPLGIGAIRIPAAGGSARADGGRFAFISGRPYRYHHDAMRTNCETILTAYFGEPYNPATAVANETPGAGFSLEQNVPNPFNPQTIILYSVVRRAVVALRIYDVSGRVVRTLVHGSKSAGTHRVTWNGRDNHGSPVASGLYFYRLSAGGRTATRKMVLLR